METADGGKTWKIESRGYGSYYFLDSKTGWSTQYDDKLDKDSIVKTEDGGKTWKVQKVFDAERVNISFFFINSQIGWAVGQEWEQTNSGPIIHNYFILHTKDGGKTWVVQLQESGGIRGGTPNEFSDVFFTNPDVGWVTGSNGIILHTKDGGKHWKHQKSGTRLILDRIYFIDDKRGLVAGDRGTAIGESAEADARARGVILYTDDGGQHWRTVWEQIPVLLTGLSFVDIDTAWVTVEMLDGTLLLHSMDGGKTWNERKLENISAYSPYFLDKDRGLLLLENNKFFITNDGGKTWRKEFRPIRPYPWHVSEIFKVQ